MAESRVAPDAEQTPNGSEPLKPDAVLKVLTSAADILAIDDIPTKLVDVPEWKAQVWLKGMSGTERDDFEESITRMRTVGRRQESTVLMHNFRAKFVARCLIDGPTTRKRLFADSEIGKLGSRSAAAIEKLFTEAQQLSGLSDEDVEELAGNLESDQSEHSGSD